MEKSFRLGCDIGGTFTDFVLLDLQTGDLRVHKVLTTPEDPAEGALSGTRLLLADAGVRASDVAIFVHGTTLAANAIIERKGARAGLITTHGFRDVLEFGREQMYDIYDVFLQVPRPLVPRPWRLEVMERVDAQGDVLTPLREEDVADAVEVLRGQGVEAVAVCLLHAYINSAHECRIRELLELMWPEVPASLSSEVAPEIREYERFSTTVANSYVQPLMRTYLERLDDGLQDLGFEGQFYPLLSSGGAVPLETAAKYPIRLVESGPAAGAVGAAFLAQQSDLGDVLAFDMGGTTAKISLVQDHTPKVAPSFEVARIHRFKKGSGLPLQIPAIDILEIGAGGGTIAWVDQLGLLKVGPLSSGAEPGPACYNLGGTEPTVTDADLVLGYLDPDYFLGGTMRLNADKAWRAMETLAGPLGMSALEAAASIHQLVNENMFSAAHIHVIEKGQDPRRFSLMAFGGSGPVHGTGVGAALGVKEVICPPAAGVLSALGLLAAPLSFEFVRSHPIRLEDARPDLISELFGDMEEVGLRMFSEAGLASSDTSILHSVDARYEGQIHEINVPIKLAEGDRWDPERLRTEFARQYQRLYHHTPGELPIEFITWRVIVTAAPPRIKLPESAPGPRNPEPALRGHRRVYYPEARSFIKVPVYDRYGLTAGMELTGPAIIEERESTIVLRPGNRGRIDGGLNVRIRL